jgi:hypothetical protein
MTEPGVAGFAAYYAGLAQERMIATHFPSFFLQLKDRSAQMRIGALFHFSVCPEIWRVRLQIEVGAPEGSDNQGRRNLRMRRNVWVWRVTFDSGP